MGMANMKDRSAIKRRRAHGRNPQATPAERDMPTLRGLA